MSTALPPLGIQIEPDRRVWVVGDTHGMLTPLRRALAEAGLIDGADNWIATNTCLVALGDMIDRGPDSRGVLELFFSLRAAAPSHDSEVVLLAGNHETMMIDGVLNGDTDMRDIWLVNGGRACLQSFGIDPTSFPSRLTEQFRAAALALLQQLAQLPQWARWRDVLMVHAGPVPGWGPEHWTAGSQHVWQRQRWEKLRWEQPEWDPYRAAGLTRFAMGHNPQEGVRTFMDGRLLAIDTNACGVRDRFTPDGRAEVTLARLPAEGNLGKSHFVVVDSHAP